MLLYIANVSSDTRTLHDDGLKTNLIEQLKLSTAI